jgi:exonuclease
MTGLDPSHDQILQICCIITDAQLQVLDEAGFEAVIHQPESTLRTMSPWCVDTHGRSGLTAAVLESRTTAPAAAADLLAYIQRSVPAPCGSGVSVPGPLRPGSRLVALPRPRREFVQGSRETVGERRAAEGCSPEAGGASGEGGHLGEHRGDEILQSQTVWVGQVTNWHIYGWHQMPMSTSDVHKIL